MVHDNNYRDGSVEELKAATEQMNPIAARAGKAGDWARLLNAYSAQAAAWSSASRCWPPPLSSRGCGHRTSRRQNHYPDAMSDAHAPYDLTTLAARCGEEARPNASTALVEPIYQSTVYAYPDLDALEAAMSGAEAQRFYYRNGTPNAATLERALAVLEDTEAALVAAAAWRPSARRCWACSRRATISITDARVYGVTYALLAEEFPRLGIDDELRGRLQPGRGARPLSGQHQGRCTSRA